MTVSIVINNVKSQIKDLDNINVIDSISRVLTYRLDSAKFSWQYKTGQWDGSTKLLTKRLVFPSGCLTSVLDVLKTKGIPYVLDDRRTFFTFPKQTLEWGSHNLYPYQNDIVDRSLSSKSGMVKVATGGGKSLIISRIAYEINLPTVIYVVSLDLLHQMHETLEECFNQKIGMVGNGICDIQKITICSAWTAGKVFSKSKVKKSNADHKSSEEVLVDKWNPSDIQKNKIKDMIENAKVAILDEAQFAAAASIKSIFDNSHSASYRYGFSATPMRTDGDDILLDAAFGDKICDISASDLIKEGYLVQPKIAFRDIPKFKTPLKKKWGTVKSNYIIENSERNNILIKNTIKLLDMGRKPLLLFQEHKHGEILKDLLPEDINYRYVTGLSSKKEREELRTDFLANKIDLILASGIFNQGINIPNLDAFVLACGGKSQVLALQRIGRCIRSHPGKTNAIVVDTFDQSHFVRKHSIRRYHTYKTEPAFLIKMGENMNSYVKRYRLQ